MPSSWKSTGKGGMVREELTIHGEVRGACNIDVLSSTDEKKGSPILGISWDQASHILQEAVSRGLARKTSFPGLIGIDEKSYGKHHHYITIVYDLDSPALDHIEFERKKESLDRYYTEKGKDASGNIEAVSMDSGICS